MVHGAWCMSFCSKFVTCYSFLPSLFHLEIINWRGGDQSISRVKLQLCCSSCGVHGIQDSSEGAPICLVSSYKNTFSNRNVRDHVTGLLIRTTMDRARDCAVDPICTDTLLYLIILFFFFPITKGAAAWSLQSWQIATERDVAVSKLYLMIRSYHILNKPFTSLKGYWLPRIFLWNVPLVSPWVVIDLPVWKLLFPSPFLPSLLKKKKN